MVEGVKDFVTTYKVVLIKVKNCPNLHDVIFDPYNTKAIFSGRTLNSTATLQCPKGEVMKVNGQLLSSLQVTVRKS